MVAIIVFIGVDVGVDVISIIFVGAPALII